MNALEATIINQTSLEDAEQLHLPINILYGRLDPIVVARNLRYLEKANPNVTLTNVLASHEVRGLFIPAVLRAIDTVVQTK